MTIFVHASAIFMFNSSSCGKGQVQLVATMLLTWSHVLLAGLELSSRISALFFPLTIRQTEVLSMTLPDACFAPLTTTGMTWGINFLNIREWAVKLIQLSQRQSIRNGDAEFAVTGDLWPALLYPHAKGDAKDAEMGIFKSALLVKVSTFFLLGFVHANQYNLLGL